MNLKNVFKQAAIEDYQRKIANLEKTIKKLTKTKEKWQRRLREKRK